MSKHFKDNQRVLINELRDCKAETGLTFSEVCKEKLAEFTNDATTRQIRMQHDLEEATYAQADQMHSVMEEHHRQLLGNRRHHIMVRLLEEKDHEVRALQQQVDALKDTNNRLKYEQMVSGVRPDIDALRVHQREELCEGEDRRAVQLQPRPTRERRCSRLDF